MELATACLTFVPQQKNQINYWTPPKAASANCIIYPCGSIMHKVSLSLLRFQQGKLAYLGYQGCIDVTYASEGDFNPYCLCRTCSCVLSLSLNQRYSCSLWWARHTGCLAWFRFRAGGCGSCACVLRITSLWFGHLIRLARLITVRRRTTTKLF
jgi:hypothetical protein